MHDAILEQLEREGAPDPIHYPPETVTRSITTQLTQPEHARLVDAARRGGLSRHDWLVAALHEAVG